eukprot:TRINITY_DN8090_c0_g1_i1.p1 TRINITY_DN8090_c0_g1~~TRINITY_DN8090_c0_g1_i1.p1  ORF type:complete len:279 (-),score=81.05 TRINITY_DN8090_c0_g1_i1:219-1055(-)
MESEKKYAWVITKFNEWRESNPEMSEAVAAVKALVEVIKVSKASTMMGLQVELKEVAELLKKQSVSTAIVSGSELFLRFVTRTSVSADIMGKQSLIERGERFLQISEKSRQKIALLGERFIRDRMVVLTHGFSRGVLSVLIQAAENEKQFEVIATESRPDPKWAELSQRLEKYGVPVTLITDSAVAHVMEKVDLVLVGAESVVESGGIVNKIGTYQISVAAKAFNCPVYVAVESFKFHRAFPLGQTDLPQNTLVTHSFVDDKEKIPSNVKIYNPRTLR